MENYASDFSSFEGKIWLNAASEGPIPNAAVRALQEAVQWKQKPYLLDHLKFAKVPQILKENIGKLINVSGRDVILGNSASYGIHLLANGIVWKKGDEILLMQDDFPTDIVPWLGLARQGVVIRQIKPKKAVLTAEELAEQMTERTKLFCISHVHTFTGHTLPVEAMARECSARGVIFVLNVSQSAGNMPLDCQALPVDAVVCAGYKWLLGPYGTGFVWISYLSEAQLKESGVIEEQKQSSARQYDIFGTANFFNYVPWTASLEYLLHIGIDRIRILHDGLIERFLKHCDPQKYSFISPLSGNARSSLVVFSHKDPTQNEGLFKHLLSQGIYTAFWKGNIRIAPHLYNSTSEIDRLVNVLNAY